VQAVEKLTGARMVDGSISGIVFVQFKVSVGQLFPTD
jgi:hypothetical protein